MSTKKDKKYCCDFMREQLTHECHVHGPGGKCPDVVIAKAEIQGGEGELLLIARNAEYTCNYCPSCGTKWPGSKDEKSGHRRWGKPKGS
jgi:hypothetical protein